MGVYTSSTTVQHLSSYQNKVSFVAGSGKGPGSVEELQPALEQVEKLVLKQPEVD
jgi:hypothetical protein